MFVRMMDIDAEGLLLLRTVISRPINTFSPNARLEIKTCNWCSTVPYCIFLLYVMIFVEIMFSELCH